MTDEALVVGLKSELKTELKSISGEVKLDNPSDDEVEDETIPNTKKKKSINNQGNSRMRSFQCGECDQAFYNNHPLKRHIQTVHLKEKNFHCSECDYKTNNQNALTNHLRAHTGEKPYGCPECGIMTTTKSALSLHIRTLHLKELRFSCELCDYKTNGKTSMKWHKAKHLGTMKANECGKCAVVFDDKIQYNEHMVTIHKFHGCEICGKAFLHMLNLKKHLHKHSIAPAPKKEKSAPAYVKPYTYTQEFKVDAVKKVKEIGLMKAARELNMSDTTLAKWRNLILRPLQCTSCGKEFATGYDLKMHVQNHHPEANESPKGTGQCIKSEHQCDKCFKCFRHKKSLRQHITKTICTNHDGKKVTPPKYSGKVCDICGITFKENRNLRNHVENVHEKIKNFFCEFCTKAFNTKSTVNKHIKSVHDNIRNFGCPFCEKKFVTNSNLKAHERKHTGEKPYQCEECGESCSKYKAKKAEYRCTHCNSALVPVICKQEGQIGEENSNKETNQSDNIKLKCEKCSKSFQCKKKLRRHMTTSKCRNDESKEMKEQDAQQTISELRELYRNKYCSNREDNQESIHKTNSDLLNYEGGGSKEMIDIFKIEADMYKNNDSEFERPCDKNTLTDNDDLVGLNAQAFSAQEIKPELKDCKSVDTLNQMEACDAEAQIESKSEHVDETETEEMMAGFDMEQFCQDNFLE